MPAFGGAVLSVHWRLTKGQKRHLDPRARVRIVVGLTSGQTIHGRWAPTDWYGYSPEVAGRAVI